MLSWTLGLLCIYKSEVKSRTHFLEWLWISVGASVDLWRVKWTAKRLMNIFSPPPPFLFSADLQSDAFRDDTPTLPPSSAPALNQPNLWELCTSVTPERKHPDMAHGSNCGKTSRSLTITADAKCELKPMLMKIIIIQYNILYLLVKSVTVTTVTITSIFVSICTRRATHRHARTHGSLNRDTQN